MRFVTTVALNLILLLVSIAPGARADEPPDHEQIVLDMIAAINERDLDALDDLVASNLRRYSGATSGLVIESLDQFKAFLEQDFATVPDSVQTVNQVFAAGDRVAVHATYAGTQQGALGPFPPTGERFVVPFIGIARIESGKIAELWVEWDNMNSLIQLGHFPPAPCEPDQAGEGEEGPATSAGEEPSEGAAAEGDSTNAPGGGDSAGAA